MNERACFGAVVLHSDEHPDGVSFVVHDDGATIAPFGEHATVAVRPPTHGVADFQVLYAVVCGDGFESASGLTRLGTKLPNRDLGRVVGKPEIADASYRIA